MGGAVHVTSPYGWITAVATSGAFFALLGIIVRQINPWRKITIDAEEKLRTDLLHRVEKLEKVLEQKDAQHAAERALDRHRINNLTACLDALLLLIEQDPKRASEAAAKVKAMRGQQLVAEATEKAGVSAAIIQAAVFDEKPAT
ncbi:hypothetical protein PQ455_01405 [Sphingomonas naphthae]|uniref:Uncharacterized protein n=1 Tax=Sphingomonas naphthae TaxID=1813468 RepID=A0ABY7TMK6_9SPHN|nr:hypothetical protein [Sphingomonas naphthae]WCT73917.1 hypothetical protein PQ455_01405 [Sphingomonas naphthae]